MATKFPKPKMIDRRKQALGYPGRGIYSRRPLKNITVLVWHYTATTHSGHGSTVIKAHEGYWRGTHGWDIGGYHYYIDRYGNIFHNYDLEICTYGASAANPYTVHISLEASAESNYTKDQLEARMNLTLWLMSDALPQLNGQKMRGHKEVPGNSTTCPGYSVSRLSSFRSEIDHLLSKGTTVAPAPKPATKQPVIDVSNTGEYTVKHGDNLWAIATAHNLTLSQIRELNHSHLKSDMLFTGQKLTVEGDVPEVLPDSGGGKETGVKDPKIYPEKGTFKFNTHVNVRNSPRLDNKPVALYNPNESVNYDRILYGASYTWLSYVSYGGTRRYVACGDNGQLYGQFV